MYKDETAIGLFKGFSPNPRELEVEVVVAHGRAGLPSFGEFILIEMDENVSALGVGAFQYEAQQLLGIKIDVIPTFALQSVEDQAFVRSVRSDSVAI